MKARIIISILLLNLCASLFAQQETKKIRFRKPLLNEHNFQSPASIQSPFIRSGLSTRLGFGFSSTMNVPALHIGNKTISGFKGELIFMNFTVSYEQRFTNWLSLYTGFHITGRLGSSISTILADGVNTINGGSVGWKFRFMHSKKLILSGSTYVKNLSGNFINVSKYINELLNGDPNPALSHTIPAMQTGARLLGAYALNATFGIQLLADLSYGESFRRTKTTTYFTGGINIDADLKPSTNIPLGFTAAYTHSSSPEIVMSDDGSAEILAFQLAYTGSSDYEIGILLSHYNLEVKSLKEQTNISRIQLALKYYF